MSTTNRPATRTQSANYRRQQQLRRKQYLRKKRIQRKRRIRLCILVIFVFGGIYLLYSAKSMFSKDNKEAYASQNEKGQNSISRNVGINEDFVSDSSEWYLRLVNENYPLTEDLNITTKALSNGEEFDSRAYDSLVKMLSDGEQQGLSMIVCSGYRSVSYQIQLFEDKIARVQEEENCTYDQAVNIAKTEVAVPGTSEHHLGLAADIVAVSYQLLDERQADTAEAQWLAANCHKYGFILRYPKGKEHITNIIYEPWHFRYVGVEAATQIMQQGITLEEYLGVYEP